MDEHAIAQALIHWLLSRQGMDCYAIDKDGKRIVDRVDALKSAFLAGAESAVALIKKGEPSGSSGKGG